MAYTLFLSFIAGHTLNWIVNGNFYNLLVHRLLVRNLSKNELFQYLEDLEKRLSNLTWVEYAASFGSICRGQLKDSSDLDVSIVRKKGLRNAFKAIIFSIQEKKLADLRKIPLELYISDTPENSINRFKAEPVPVVLYDPHGVMNHYYSNVITLSKAKENNIILLSSPESNFYICGKLWEMGLREKES